MAKYKETTDEVIRESALLNDEKKLKAEFYDDKIRSILGSISFTVKVGLSYTQMYHLYFSSSSVEKMDEKKFRGCI